jgi:hypothetical protein
LELVVDGLDDQIGLLICVDIDQMELAGSE